MLWPIRNLLTCLLQGTCFGISGDRHMPMSRRPSQICMVLISAMQTCVELISRTPILHKARLDQTRFDEVKEPTEEGNEHLKAKTPGLTNPASYDAAAA
jgi:hypothetical protein